MAKDLFLTILMPTELAAAENHSLYNLKLRIL